MPSIVIVLDGMFTDMNTYIAAANRSRHLSNKIKVEETARVQASVMNRYPAIPENAYPINYTYHWYWRNAKVDKGNIAFAEKYIADGLQAAHITRGDGWNDVGFIHHDFYIDRGNERVEVELSWSDETAIPQKPKRLLRSAKRKSPALR